MRSGLDSQLGYRCVRLLELDLEDALDRRGEVEPHGTAGLHILRDVVPVHVDLGGRIRTDLKPHGVALAHRDLRHGFLAEQELQARQDDV